MRDWNSRKEVRDGHRHSKLIAYLWGIETLGRVAGLPKFFKLIAYLWGIETRQICLFACRRTDVDSLPMRDWNAGHQLRRSKNLSVDSLPMRDWNRQWNWPLLYGDWVDSLPMRDWNNEALRIPWPLPRVDSLPMRDWNPDIKNTFSYKVRALIAYLWGIETFGWGLGNGHHLSW